MGHYDGAEERWEERMKISEIRREILRDLQKDPRVVEVNSETYARAKQHIDSLEYYKGLMETTKSDRMLWEMTTKRAEEIREKELEGS